MCVLIFSLSIIIAVSAKGFEYDDLYITVHLELPDCKLIVCAQLPCVSHSLSLSLSLSPSSLSPPFLPLPLSVWMLECEDEDVLQPYKDPSKDPVIITQISRTKSKHLVDI